MDNAQLVYYVAGAILSVLTLLGIFAATFGNTRLGRFIRDHFKTVRQLISERDEAQAAAARAALSAKYATERADALQGVYESIETRMGVIEAEHANLRLDLDKITRRFHMAVICLQQQIHYSDVLSDMLSGLVPANQIPARPPIHAELQSELDALPRSK